MNDTENIPEFDKDFKERIEGMTKELQPLLGKYELGLSAFPEFTQHGTVVARPFFASTRKAPATEKVEEKESEVKDTAGLSE